MKRASITLNICFALTMLFAVAVPQAKAQSVTRNGAGLSNPETSSVDDATLKKAAHAFPRIRQINLKIRERLKETEGTQKQREVVSQAHDQETMIVRQEGIDPDQYNEIMRLRGSYLSSGESLGIGSCVRRYSLRGFCSL